MSWMSILDKRNEKNNLKKTEYQNVTYKVPSFYI